VIPAIRPAAAWLHEEFGWFALFSTSLSGPGMFPAALVLAIMVLPTIAAVSQDALRAVPQKMHEAVYGMGATRWEAIIHVILPAASASIFGAMVLGLGRALGETMALAMLVGNSNQISLSLFSPANTLAASLALNFPEAGPLESQALMFSALVLLSITLLVNILGTAIVTRSKRRLEAGR
jgi:phosphate transport system permease protein